MNRQRNARIEVHQFCSQDAHGCISVAFQGMAHRLAIVRRPTVFLADTASYASRPHLRGAQRGKEQIYNERYDLDHFETADL